MLLPSAGVGHGGSSRVCKVLAAGTTCLPEMSKTLCSGFSGHQLWPEGSPRLLSQKCVPESARIDASSAQVQLWRPPWSRWALEGPQPREPSEGAPCAQLPLPLDGPGGTPSTCVGLCAPLSVWTQVSWGTDSFPAPFSTWPCGASLQLKVSLVREGHKEVAWQSSGTPPTPVHNGHLAPFKATPNKAEHKLK